VNEVIFPHIPTLITWLYLIGIGYCIYRGVAK
jgi:hypothetical protein